MNRIQLLTIVTTFVASHSLLAVEFHPISSVSSTSESDLWAASNLIQGPGPGFDESEPHDQTPAGDSNLWVTADPGGFPSDYIDVAGPPILTIDLGSDVVLNEISVWGYSASNANGVKNFTLRFATDAEGPESFASSIAYSPSFELENEDVARQSLAFEQAVTARYVEFTCDDNFFTEEMDPPGGDRVGLGEIGFASEGGAPPESPQFFEIVEAEASTADSDLWPVSNLIQGPGVGFDANAPYDSTSTGEAGAWVTADPGGFPSDYIEAAGPPILLFDLGVDQELNEISVWGYSETNSNGVSEFSLKFATDAEGKDGLGTSITYNPTFEALIDETPRQQNFFEETITARYVEMTCLDNFFTEEMEVPGGDRVGLGEVAFEDVVIAVQPSLSVGTLFAVGISDQAVPIEIPITNTGAQDLVIETVTLSGDQPEAFMIVSSPDTVASLNTESIQISVDPTGFSADVSAILTITSNDPEQPSIEVTLQGLVAPSFYPIASINSSTDDTDLWPASNLIQGPGEGFDEMAPHDKLIGAADGNWVTDAPGGFPADYIEEAGAPIIILDLGEDVILAEISMWGYASTNANGVSEFSVQFATDADGEAGFGLSVDFNPTYTMNNDDTIRNSFDFERPVVARFVELTLSDNHFVEPGDATADPPGGDRLGFGEVAFQIKDVTLGQLSAPFAVNFGTLPGVSGSQEQTITLVNDSEENTVTVIESTLSGDDTFFSVGSIPSEFLPGAMSDLPITFTPTGALGTFTAELSIETDNGEETSVTKIRLVARTENSSGLIAHYKMDETDGDTMLDSSGNDRHGIYGAVDGGSVTLGAEGLATGSAVAFSDGGGAGAGFGRVDDFTALDTVSYSLWLNVDPADEGTTSGLFGLGEAGNPFGVAFGSTEDPDFMQWLSAGTEISLESSPVLESSKLTHVVFTYSSENDLDPPVVDRLVLYVDGVKTDEALGNPGYTAGITGPFTVGAVLPTIGYTGVIDDFQIYDREISADDALFLFSNPGMSLDGGGGLLDSDNDGLTNEEEGNLGTNPTKPDTDSDGASDGAEVAAGTDPLDSASTFTVQSTSRTGNEVTLVWSSIAGKTYAIQSSNDLKSESWTDVSTELAGADGTSSETVSATDAALFYRVVVE